MPLRALAVEDAVRNVEEDEEDEERGACWREREVAPPGSPPRSICTAGLETKLHRTSPRLNALRACCSPMQLLMSRPSGIWWVMTCLPSVAL
jgi:hypothetical protein